MLNKNLFCDRCGFVHYRGNAYRIHDRNLGRKTIGSCVFCSKFWRYRNPFNNTLYWQKMVDLIHMSKNIPVYYILSIHHVWERCMGKQFTLKCSFRDSGLQKSTNLASNKTLYNIWKMHALDFLFPFQISQIIKHPWQKRRISSWMESHSGFLANKMEEVDLSVCRAKNDIIFLDIWCWSCFQGPPTFCHFCFRRRPCTRSTKKKKKKLSGKINAAVQSGFRNVKNSKSV